MHVFVVVVRRKEREKPFSFRKCYLVQHSFSAYLWSSKRTEFLLHLARLLYALRCWCLLLSSFSSPRHHADNFIMSAVVSTSSSHHEGRSKLGKNVTGSSSSKSSAKLVPLNEKLLRSFYPDKTYGNPVVTTGNSITSICFDDRGDRLLTCGDDEKIQLFSLSSGRLASTNYSKKYGVDLARFTHDINNMVHASTKVDHAIRYHSLAENKYLSYFRGHTNRVSSLDMSPTSANAFMSAAVYESVRLWDLRSASSQACMVVQGHPIIRYDPTGTIFALAFNETNKVLLYDARKWAEVSVLNMILEEVYSH